MAEETKKVIHKRFPANVSLEDLTFLNDRKIDGELYAIYQKFSYPDGNKRTVVKKSDLPSQKALCEKIGVSSPKTLRAHRNYLIEKGFLEEEDSVYVLPNREDVFLMIPLETLQLFYDTMQEQVIKIYIYLGQRWNYKKDKYIFTEEEIGKHIGMKSMSSRNYTTVKNILRVLKKLSLIDYEFITQLNGEGIPVTRMRLVNFSLTPDLGG